MSERVERISNFGGACVEFAYWPVIKAKGQPIPVRILALAATPFWFALFGLPACLMLCPCLILITVIEMWESMR